MNPLLLAVAAAQGRRLRRTVEVLPPASGPTTGTAPSRTGSPIQLAVLGESTAAGCGAGRHEDAFVGFFAHALAVSAGRPVVWRVIGQSGATVRRLRHRLLPLLDEDVDLAVVLIGVNDVLTRRPVAQWTDDLAAVLDTLNQRAPRVVLAGVPPFAVFPSLPRTLGRYLGEQAGLLDDAAQCLCEARPGVTWISSRDLVATDPAFFARDGFHPSPAGYRHWAEAVVDRLPAPGQG